MKVGRNSPCPCGSGKKYKKCCLDKNVAAPPQLPPAALKEIARRFQRVQRQEAERQARFGQLRPVIHADHGGLKFVAVGSRLYYGNWRTFADFLFDYVGGTFGGDWFKDQLARPDLKRHPVARMYSDLRVYTASLKKDSDGLYKADPPGPVAAYLNLAYDLYVLRHHQALQDAVVSRLKQPDQFQGARYELYVTATCIRAGFDIEHEDESDPTRKHTEFLARHKVTGQPLSVEAKSRHRPGVLGHEGEVPHDEMKAGVGHLLRKAIAKEPDGPFVIFLDLNLPPVDSSENYELLTRELAETVDSVAVKEGEALCNLIVFSNNPHHYVGAFTADPPSHILAMLLRNPRFKADNPQALEALCEAATQYGNIPNDFPPDFGEQAARQYEAAVDGSLLSRRLHAHPTR